MQRAREIQKGEIMAKGSLFGLSSRYCWTKLANDDFEKLGAKEGRKPTVVKRKEEWLDQGRIHNYTQEKQCKGTRDIARMGKVCIIGTNLFCG
jgi:hypothetical protein